MSQHARSVRDVLDVARSLADLVVPPRCVLCRSPGRGLCPPCAAQLRPAAHRAPPEGLLECRSLLDYDDGAAALVAAIKFHNHRDVLDLLGAALAELTDDLAVDVITWAPTSVGRRRRRGYDQAELLAASIARHKGLRSSSLLLREPGSAQTGADRATRLNGPRFRARGQHTGRVLLVDDVCTTGSTLRAAAEVLTRHGAAAVAAVTVASVA